jgi:SAM-dependent methyltransferase
VQPYYADDDVRVFHGDCRDVLAQLDDGSVDAVVTDPPYELAFLGRAWDASGIAYDVDMWRECLRVLKPGGHLLAFGGTRTYHRMTCAIEDAGFQIRDSIHWIYGGGFPKGQSIDKSIDRHRDDRADILRVTAFLSEARKAAGWTVAQIDAAFGTNGMASHWTSKTNKAAAVPTLEQWQRLREMLGFESQEMDELVLALNARKGKRGAEWAKREVVGHRNSGLAHGGASIFLKGTGQNPGNMIPVTAPASEAARRWQGWHTSLKPAHEPIVVARRSTGFNSTAANVLEWGTGALNIDGCRAGSPGAGRWPANLVVSHSPDCIGGGPCDELCPVAEMDRQDDGASKFFPAFRYEAKAPPGERPKVGGVAHPTTKPLALMRWLVRLVTPPGGLVLDPFAGSGTTLEAAVIEGFRAVGIEQEADYLPLIKARLSKPLQPTLSFDGEAG